MRRVVKAVKDGGGRPFVTDHAWSALTAAERGYTAETLGCPIFPVAGPDEKYFYTFQRPYKNIKEWGMGGMLHDATFLLVDVMPVEKIERAPLGYIPARAL